MRIDPIPVIPRLAGYAVASGDDGPKAVPAIFNAMSYAGMDNTGVADCSDAIDAMLADWYSAGGGTLYFPRGTYLVNDQILIPNNSAATPSQPSLRIIGDGASHNGQGGAPNGGTQLDLRYNGAGVAKIDTRGLGLMEIAHITLKDGGTDAKPFLQTTNTTLHIHHVEVYGTKIGVLADQDVFILGGESDTLDGTDDAPFQGYGTIIEACYFNKIRRGVYGRTYCNGVIIRDNTWWISCGSNSSSAAAIEFQSYSATEYDAGNLITGNLIEIHNYPYAMRFTRFVANTIIANNFYDPSATCLAIYRFEATATYNTIIDGFHSDATTYMSDASSGANTRITAHQGQSIVITSPVTFSNAGTGVTTEYLTANKNVLSQPSVATDYAYRAKKSGDAVERFVIAANGALQWGNGTDALDTGLRRISADLLGTDDAFRVYGPYLFVDAIFRHLGSTIGFYGASAVAKQTVTGSRGGNAALASLLTALANLGLITDSTS